MSNPTDWHYAGFGITHTGSRENCEPCMTARQMAVEAWNDWSEESGLELLDALVKPPYCNRCGTTHTVGQCGRGDR